MIKMNTLLDVVDNSGAKKALCIKVFQNGTIGNTVLISVRQVNNKQKMKVAKGEMHKAVIVQTKKEKRRKDGSLLHTSQNAVVLLGKKDSPLGTRIGSVSYELRKFGFVKILSLASHIV
jgi:large subunit ribosomal protein L14